MDERLVVSGQFDASGIVAGVSVGAAALQEFERRLQQVAASLPGINVEEFLAGARQAAQAEIADLHRDPYTPDTLWYKIKNGAYTQMEGRGELFHPVRR